MTTTENKGINVVLDDADCFILIVQKIPKIIIRITDKHANESQWKRKQVVHQEEQLIP